MTTDAYFSFVAPDMDITLDLWKGKEEDSDIDKTAKKAAACVVSYFEFFGKNSLILAFDSVLVPLFGLLAAAKGAQILYTKMKSLVAQALQKQPPVATPPQQVESEVSSMPQLIEPETIAPRVEPEAPALPQLIEPETIAPVVEPEASEMPQPIEPEATVTVPELPVQQAEVESETIPPVAQPEDTAPAETAPVQQITPEQAHPGKTKEKPTRLGRI